MLSRKTCGTRNKLCSGTWNNIVNKVQTLFQRDLVNKTRTEQSLKNWNKDDFAPSTSHSTCIEFKMISINMINTDQLVILITTSNLTFDIGWAAK